MLNISSYLPHTHRSVLEICQALPGYLLVNERFDTARDVLLRLVDYAGLGVVPSHPGKYKPPADAATTFWFAHAAYAYVRASGDRATWDNALLPLVKRIAQTLISSSLGDTTMTDAGLVVESAAKDAYPLGLNTLWYSTLTMLAEELAKVGDASGSHFDRLAGRFRRSFAKMFWCAPHQCLCDPRSKAAAGHYKVTFVPAPDQLLAVVLPFSPVAQTKQRQIVASLKAANVSDLGMRVPWTLNVEAGERARSGRRPEIVSPLYLAWLAEALLKVSDGSAEALAQADGWMNSLKSLEAENDGHLAWLYELRSQRPAGATHRAVTHGPTVAEVARVARLVAQLKAARPG
jgi:hypothetical protein